MARLERHLFPRYCESRIRKALRDARVVAITGPRQAGKSTLARSIVAGRSNAEYESFDDLDTLARARSDPAAFVSGRRGLLVVDEVQLFEDIAWAIKREVDRDARPGRFLLTGSARFLSLPGLVDPLVGRVALVELWPLSQGELTGSRERFVDTLLSGRLDALKSGAPLGRRQYLERASRGGYPEAVHRPSRSRSDWFEDYVATSLRREVRELADIGRYAELPRLAELIAARTGSPLNTASLARDADIPARTLSRYVALLEAVQLVTVVPAWRPSGAARAARAPKLVLSDSGLCHHLLGGRLDEPVLGALLETFVLMELRKQLTWSEERASLSHYRTWEGNEVDAVLETRDGRVAGVEVKAGGSVRASDVRGLHNLAAKTGDRFAGGVVLCSTREYVHITPTIAAVPISALWDTADQRARRG